MKVVFYGRWDEMDECDEMSMINNVRHVIGTEEDDEGTFPLVRDVVGEWIHNLYLCICDSHLSDSTSDVILGLHDFDFDTSPLQELSGIETWESLYLDWCHVSPTELVHPNQNTCENEKRKEEIQPERPAPTTTAV